MQKCTHADKYQGRRPPTCNNGKGCETCKAKYDGMHRAKSRRLARMRG